MERYTTEQRTKTIEFYIGNQQSIVLTQCAYRQYFNVRATHCTPDCFLWAYLKEQVHINKLATILQLKTNIRNEICAITPEILQKVTENVLKRARMCKAENGHHLQDVIFRI
ncbi:hypothetical protein ILUMI_23604 [Ignelater luminosus]|uniref:DUF4817 domain-containing protein n=1 Tax=Ignelater luminosus TaxID=2038154 RepID=A0A8K0CC73_IGNLU|nr:hypothetical protein ILUMI_23604 [Ignelater luminosus]